MLRVSSTKPWCLHRYRGFLFLPGMLLPHPLLKGGRVFLANDNIFRDEGRYLQQQLAFRICLYTFDGAHIYQVFTVNPVKSGRVNLGFNIGQGLVHYKLLTAAVNHTHELVGGIKIGDLFNPDTDVVSASFYQEPLFKPACRGLSRLGCRPVGQGLVTGKMLF